MTAGDADRAWIRSWPLLLVTVVLGVAAAWAFATEGNSTASIASFCAALIFGGAWLATAVVEWHHRLHRGGSDDEAQP
jgi:heme/copper-type cytochrome/quinol oxidase subunit 3